MFMDNVGKSECIFAISQFVVYRVTTEAGDYFYDIRDVKDIVFGDEPLATFVEAETACEVCQALALIPMYRALTEEVTERVKKAGIQPDDFRSYFSRIKSVEDESHH